MRKRKANLFIVAVFGCFYAVFAYSAVSLFSDYGQIQNVQNYSTNPFWSPNAPYNQRVTPQPVYVQGVNVTTEECTKVIQSAVAFQCSARDNCRNTSLADIRPSIIVQLSNLPNKAYGTACIGYLDSVYESYVAQFGNNVPTSQVNFPGGTVPNPALNNNKVPVKNPYEVKTPQWQQEINDRNQELQNLQRQNGAGNEGLSATSFPTTYADLSFGERMANNAAGYAPYQGKSPYNTIKIKNTEEWCQNHDGPECHQKNVDNSQTQNATTKPANNNTNNNNPANNQGKTDSPKKNSDSDNNKPTGTTKTTSVNNQTLVNVPEKDRVYGGFVCENNRMWQVIATPVEGYRKAYDLVTGWVTGEDKQPKISPEAEYKGILDNDSSANPAVINCQNLDEEEGCYTVCGQPGAQDNDDLNTKVFKPILGKSYCVNKNDYMLQEVGTNKPLTMTQTQWAKVKNAVEKNVVEQGHCSGNEDDIDFYYGHYASDSTKSGQFFNVDGIIRLDD